MAKLRPSAPGDGRPLVIGMTGATGAIYGIRLLEVLSEFDIETHLLLTSPRGR
ncbi:MAG: hypothetical protein ACRDUY_09145 [Nitriliruptorales bacterium]